MNQKTETNDMRPEYDFSGGIRGKHYKAYQEDTNVVLHLQDENDNFLVELAVAGNAEKIVTYNIQDLEDAELKFSDLKIVKPEQLMRGS